MMNIKKSRAVMACLALCLTYVLNACDASQSNTKDDNTKANLSQSDVTPVVQTPSLHGKQQSDENHSTVPTPVFGADGKITLDVAKFETGVKRAALEDYVYPFDENSQAVQNYARTYQITAKQAQHAITLSMASPEILNKVLDEIVGEYVGHSIIDGAELSLVIFTTDKVNPANFEYVIADKFGGGLVLPVEVVHASSMAEKPQVDLSTVGEKFKNDE